MSIETNITLRVFGLEVDPDAISAELGHKPTEFHKKGDRISARVDRVRDAGYWALVSSSEVAPSADTNEHIEWLFHRVMPMKDKLRSYLEHGWTVDVWVAVHTDAGHGGPTLRADSLTKLGLIGLPVQLDLYPDA